MYSETLNEVKPMQEEARLKEPSRQYFLREYPINIKFLSIGCVVEVGCKSIPFTSVDEAMKEINEYVANPREMQEKWRKILD
jgi:hypothetical protein